MQQVCNRIAVGGRKMFDDIKASSGVVSKGCKAEGREHRSLPRSASVAIDDSA